MFPSSRFRLSAFRRQVLGPLINFDVVIALDMALCI
jgi:hypothetical protein